MVGDHRQEDRAMHRFAATATVGFVLTAAAGLVSASEPPVSPISGADRCAAAPRESFRPEADLAEVVGRLGYQVERLDTDAGCYAVLAVDRRGKRFDMRFEGASLKMVSRRFARSEADVVAQR